MLDFDELEPDEPPARRTSPYLYADAEACDGPAAWERRYRQAYADGYAAALESLAALAQEGEEAETIHDLLSGHWEEELLGWLAADCRARAEPPEFA